MLWIAVCLPELPLEVAATEAPLAVCDTERVLLAKANPIIKLATMEGPLGAIFWAITTPRGSEAMLKPPAKIVAG